MRYHRKNVLSEDHPRACGENFGKAEIEEWFEGSPPRMRGKRTHGYHALQVGGITPAHAGKTQVVLGKLQRAEDHPRACGENFNAVSFYDYKKGSPPRMRGKLGKAIAFQSDVRITPAHAGKT